MSDSAVTVPCVVKPLTTVQSISGIVLLVFLCISYIPQYITIFRGKSSSSISYATLFIGSVNNLSYFVNGVLLQFNRLECCVDSWSTKTCLDQIMGPIIQLGCQWVLYTGIFIVAVVYPKGHTKKEYTVSRRLAVALFVYNVALIATAISLLMTVGYADVVTVRVAQVVGVVNLLGTLIQWAPQIYTLYVKKRVGQLSLPYLFIQAPGAVVFAYFQAGPEHESPFTYLPYVAAALQHYICLFMGLFYYFQERARAKRRAERLESQASLLPQRTPNRDGARTPTNEPSINNAPRNRPMTM